MSKQTVPAEEGFVITVGVPHENTRVHCDRALTVLRQAGYMAGPTSDEAKIELGRRALLEQDADTNGKEEEGDYS